MADDILIKVGADVKGVITAIDTTTRLENRVKKLVKAYETGRVAPEQFNDALGKISKSAGIYSKSVETYSKSLQEANKAEKEAAAAAKAAKQEALALAQARKEQLAVERKAKEEARAFAQVRRQAEADNRAFDAQQKQDIANTKAQAAEKERLAAKYVPLYAASKQYERALEEINRAQELGVISDKQRSASIEQLNADFAAGTGMFSRYSAEAARRTNQIGVVTQQVGYQVGDFLVQVQSGTNALVAFGQQATQLVGVLPLMGAGFLGLSGGALIALSAGLGILIPLVTALGAAFLRTRDGGKTLQQTVDELKTSTQALVTVTEGYTLTGLVDLEEKYGQVNAQVLQLVESQKFLAQSELNKSIADTTKALRELAGARWFDLGISDRASSLLNLQTQFDVTKQDAEVLLEAFEEMASAERGSLAQADALAKISSLLKIVLQNTDDVTQAQLDALKAVVDTEDAIREMNAAAPKASWMNAAREGVAGLYRNIVAAITKVKELKSEGSPTRPRMRPMDLESTFEEERARGQTRPRSREEALFGEFFGSPDTAGGSAGGGKTQAEQMAETIANFEKQLRLEEELVGVSEARKRIIQALGVEFVNQNAAAVAKYEADIARITELNRLEEQRESLINSVGSSMESGFMAMVEGTKSVKDAFKNMAREVIKELYRVLVVQRMVGAISGSIGGLGSLFSGPAPGSTASILGSVKPFANGGVVNGPTMFPMSGGQTGLMGEAGPEAIMPLKRDKNGRLGVSVDGGSGSVVVNNNINVTGGSDPAAIRMEVAKLMPQITNATKAAVIDARRRGGQMKASFG